MYRIYGMADFDEDVSGIVYGLKLHQMWIQRARLGQLRLARRTKVEIGTIAAFVSDSNDRIYAAAVAFDS